MTKTVPTLEVLKRALAIIQERGWDYRFPHTNKSPVNIPWAISRACTLTGTEDVWHAGYGTAMAALLAALHAGVPEDHRQGLMDWEFGPRSRNTPKRTQAEVEELFTRAINRWEQDEAQVVSHGGMPSRSGGDPRAV